MPTSALRGGWSVPSSSMPPLMSTSKESPRGDVCAAQRHGVISTAETMSTAAEARNLHRLIILFVLPFRGRLLDCTTPTEICSRAKNCPYRKLALSLWFAKNDIAHAELKNQRHPDRRSLVELTKTRHVTHYYMVLGERLKG